MPGRSPGSGKPLSVKWRERWQGCFNERFEMPAGSCQLRDFSSWKVRGRSSFDATVHLYLCTLPALTLYGPMLHRRNFLRGVAQRLAPVGTPV